MTSLCWVASLILKNHLNFLQSQQWQQLCHLPHTAPAGSVSFNHLFELNWAAWRAPDSPSTSWRQVNRKLFSPRAERIWLSLADGWHQHQPGHENSEGKLTMCVGNQGRGKLLVNSFLQNICSVLVKILYTPCSCWRALPELCSCITYPTSSNSSGSLQQEGQPQQPLLPPAFPAVRQHQEFTPYITLQTGILHPADSQGHPPPPLQAGRKGVGKASPCEFFSQRYLHFWITYILMPSEPAGQQLKWSESYSSILCMAGSQEYTNSTWILCFTWTKLQFDQLCFLKRRDLLVLICSRQQMSWKQTYLFLDQWTGFLGLSSTLAHSYTPLCRHQHTHDCSFTSDPQSL